MSTADIEEAIEEIKAAKVQLETIPAVSAEGLLAGFKLMQIIVQSHDRLERAISILEEVK